MSDNLLNFVNNTVNKVKPQISVIIPVYNAQYSIERCLTSILTQDLDDLEVICVDDGSTDKSVEIIKAISREDHRVICIQQKNQYAGVARNNGLQIASGEYVTFIDSDDWIEPLSLKKIYEIAKDNDVDMLKTVCRYFDAQNGRYSSGGWISLKNQIFNVVTNYKTNKELVNLSDTPWSGLYKRKFLSKNKITFDNYPVVNDTGFFIKSLVLSEKVIVTDILFTTYVINQKNSLISKRYKHFDFQIKIFEDYYIYLKSFGNEKQFPILKRLFQAILGRYSSYIDSDVLQLSDKYKIKKMVFKFFSKNEYQFLLNHDYFKEIKEKANNIIPLISIIVPVFNNEKELDNCLSSAVEQTYHNLEIICIDDGSIDNSTKIIDKYCSLDQRIKLLTQKNRGFAAARNIGIDIAQGEYVYFLEATDCLEPCAIEDLYSCFNIESDIDFSSSSVRFISTAKEEQKSTATDIQSFDDIRNLMSIKSIPLDITSKDCLFPFNKLYKSKLIKTHGLKFAEELDKGNEALVWLWMYSIHSQKYCLLKKKNHLSSIGGIPSIDVTRKPNDVHVIEFYKYMLSHTPEYVNNLHFDALINLLYVQANSFVQNCDLDSLKELSDTIAEYKNHTESLALKNKCVELLVDIEKRKIKPTSRNSDLPLISVIIPIYNGEKYLGECLESITDQSLKNIQIICINDHSTDSTSDIINEMIAKDSRITIINNPHNVGAGASRNLGIKQARGEYISFIDSDDFISYNFLENMYITAKLEDADICATPNLILYPSFEKKRTGIKSNESISTPLEKREIILSTGVACNKIYRKSFLLKNHIEYFENSYGEDNTITSLAVILANKIAVSNNSIYYYRVNKNSTTHNIDKKIVTVPNVYNYLINKLKDLFAPLPKTMSFWTETVLSRAKVDFADCYRKTDNKLKKELKTNISKYFPNLLPLTQYAEPIVSLTSYPPRIQFVCQAVKSLLNQSVYYKKVILWLAEEQFLNKEEDLPSELLKLQLYNDFEIKWTKDIKSYKKLIPALIEYPNDVIITADDDLLYPNDWLERLLCAYFNQPNYVHALRVHRIKFNSSHNAVMPYKLWEKEITSSKPSYLNFFTGVAGCLYPPNCLFHTVTDEKTFMSLCPFGDDIWFWGHAVMNRTKINLVTPTLAPLNYVPGSQDGNIPLYKINIDQNKNDEQLNNVLNRYPNIKKQLVKELNRTEEGYLLGGIIKIKRKSRNKDYKKISFCGLELYKQYNSNDGTHDVDKHFRILGIPLLEIKKRIYHKKIYLCGIQLYKREVPTENIKRIFVLGLPIYSQKICDYKIKKRILFFRTTRHEWQRRVIDQENLLIQQNEQIKSLIDRTDLIEKKILNVIDVYHKNLSDSFESINTNLRKNLDAKCNETKYFISELQEPFPYALLCQQWYSRISGKQFDINNPKTFNEKIQWRKIFEATPLITKLTDKYKVREWVKEKIGDKYLIPILGVYKKYEDINFDNLPEKFVIKCNHGSSMNYIVKDKKEINRNLLRNLVNNWLHTDYSKHSYELQYHNIERLIIIEQYMEDESGNLRDYKFTCFNGKPDFLWVDSDRYENHRRNVYDLNWNLLNCRISGYSNFPSPPKPQKLSDMITIASILSKDFSYVRVDLYLVNSKIYFGEMTFTSESGTATFEPIEFENKLSEKLILPQRKYNPFINQYIE